MRTASPRLLRWSIGLLVTLLVELSAAADSSGQYFQAGARRITFHAPGQLPQALISLQVNLGTRENCESRLAVIAKTKDVAESLGGPELWCSPNSATARLKFHGAFRNRLTGQTLVLESDSIELCASAVEVLTGGQAANNKIEVVTPCQAR